MDEKLMNYKRMREIQQKAKAMASSSGGIDFLDQWYAKVEDPRPAHFIFPDNEEGYIPVPVHVTDDRIEYPCTMRDDCRGCKDGDDIKDKFGVTVIACEWLHDVEITSFRGDVRTALKPCPGERGCPHCKAVRAGDETVSEAYFGRKQVGIFPVTQFAAITNMVIAASRKCRKCNNKLVPTTLMCPECNEILLEVGEGGVTYEMVIESYEGKARCPDHGFVASNSIDVCMDPANREVACPVAAPGDQYQMIINVKKTGDNFPTLVSDGAYFEDFWSKNKNLTHGCLPTVAFVPDWEPEMQGDFLNMRRKIKKNPKKRR